MSKIIQYLRQHLRQSFHPIVFIWMLLLLGGGMLWRYGMKGDPFFRSSSFTELWGLLFYAIPYLGTVAVIAWTKKCQEILKDRGFWILSACLLFVLFANQFMFFYRYALELLPNETHYFFRKVFFNLHTCIFYLGVPLLFWFWRESQKPASFYGLTVKNFKASPYVIMLLLMLPLLIWASFQPDFLKAYPRYRGGGSTEAYWEVGSWLTVGAYELSYILQFIFLELFFRGFMVMKLEKYIGEASVFPMVAVYCFIHFGKPMPEALGSIFGGYILGVVALYSRSVFGGVLIHVGVALGMELFAYLQLYIRGA